MKKNTENKTLKRRRVPVPKKPPKVIKSKGTYNRKKFKGFLRKELKETGT